MQTIKSPSIHPLGYMVGDWVEWCDPFNRCRWGKCAGIIMIGTQDYNEGEFVTFWTKTCSRHPAHKHTETDSIDKPHVQIRFA